jgi:hypothetical protein
VPRITGTSAAPLVAAAGDRIAIFAKLAGIGRRVVLGLVLGSANGSPRGGVRLGDVTVAYRGTRRVVVRGRVPVTVSPGVLGTLLVCVDPAAAIRGGGACRKAGRIATSGTSAEERIAGARQAGRLSRANAVLFGLLALRGDSRVPAELRGGLGGPGGDGAAIKAAADSYGALPRAVQKQVLPFFVPPPGQGTAWSTPGRKSRSRGRHAAAAAATLDCTGYAKLDRGYSSGNLYPWRGVPTSDGKAIVWYQAYAADPPREARDRVAAYRYARELPKIWAKLTKEFGAPLSDANEPCYHGPDGRYDVYVDNNVVSIESRFARGVNALTITYWSAGGFCTHRPSWIAIRNDQPNWALAHEFMHAIQFSHRYLSCAGPIAWWDEGGATWAGDFVYPDDNTERDWPELVTAPLGQQLTQTDYTAWPFWMMLQRTQGIGVLRAIFASLATKPPVAAIDAAIPGGFARQLPRFFLYAYNHSPVGDAGFTIPQSFQAWDHWNANPSPPAPIVLNLGALPADTLALPIQRSGFPPLSLGAYHRVSIADDRIKELRFTNDLAGKPGGHVDAMLHLADGSWKLADWTASKTVTLCRDKPAENVREMIIVSTNAGKAPLGAFTHTLRVSSHCGSPKLSGTFSGTQHAGAPPFGSPVTLSWSGSASLQPSHTGPVGAFPNETWQYYQLTGGSVSWQISYADSNGCTGSGSGTVDLGQQPDAFVLQPAPPDGSAAHYHLDIEGVTPAALPYTITCPDQTVLQSLDGYGGGQGAWAYDPGFPTTDGQTVSGTASSPSQDWTWNMHFG